MLPFARSATCITPLPRSTCPTREGEISTLPDR